MINILLLKLTSEDFFVRIKKANLARKNDITNLIKKTNFDNKSKYVTSNKNELKEPSKKFNAISTKGLRRNLINKFSILNRAKFLSSGIFQNYLLFIPAKKCIKYFSDTTQIESWKSNGM